MIEGRIEAGDILKGSSEKAKDAARKTMGRLVLELLRKVKTEKLSGDPLKVKTGRLRRSIHSRTFEENDVIYGEVGTNVDYGRVHEYGFNGNVNVRQHNRVVSKVFGKSVSPVTQTVSAHTRKVNLPERSFLRSALREFDDKAQQELLKEIGRAIK